MTTILLGIFKRWFCLIPACIFLFIGYPLNVMLLFIPQGLYWLITGRDLLKDSRDFLEWVLN
jgi:hypothetical protein